MRTPLETTGRRIKGIIPLWWTMLASAITTLLAFGVAWGTIVTRVTTMEQRQDRSDQRIDKVEQMKSTVDYIRGRIDEKWGPKSPAQTP